MLWCLSSPSHCRPGGTGKGGDTKLSLSPLLSSDDVSRSPCFHGITEVFQAAVRCFHLDGSELASAHIQKEQHGYLRLLQTPQCLRTGHARCRAVTGSYSYAWLLQSHAILPDNVACGVFHWFPSYCIYTERPEREEIQRQSTVMCGWQPLPSGQAIKCQFLSLGTAVLMLLPDRP